MDFPVCPACGQSVIDDDAEDCPFCGSSMKAKPGAKPAAPKPGAAPAKPSATAAKPNMPAKPGPAAKSPGAKPGAADDFPFDADLPASKSALQAMPNATKQRSLKVICPMCETAGYVVPTAVGQEVKCANSKCMVPVFRVPVPVVEAPPPPPKKSNLLPILGLTAVVAVVGGLGIFVLPGLLASKPKPSGLSDEAREMMAEMSKGKSAPPASTNAGTAASPTTTGTPKEAGTKTAAGPKSPADLMAEARKQLDDSCLVGDRRQRSKPFCRQLAAEACSILGDAAAAREHLNQFEVVGRDVPYYRIPPHLEEFWTASAAGDKAAATKALDAALADAPKIPKQGRNRLEISGRLAAALASAGRIPEALTILQTHQATDGEGQLAARNQMSSDGRLSRLSLARAVLPWSVPQAVAATAALVARGQLAAARDWAAAQTNPEAQAECLAVWAEGVARGQAQPGSAAANADLAQAVKNLPPQLAARVWARAACGRFAAKDAAGTAATLKVASELLATVPVPAEPTLPEVKLTTKFAVPAAAPLVQAATTAAEIAFVQALSPETRADADASLDLALQFARGLAPGWSAVSQRADDAEQLGATGLNGLLKRELSLKSDDEARLAVGRYRASLKEITEAARRRFELQTAILTRLAQVGLKEKVWLVVSSRSADSDLNRRDDFLDTPLVGELLELFHGTETEKAIQGALPPNAAPAQPESTHARQLLGKGETQEAAEFVSGLDAKSGQRDELALTLAAWLVQTDKLDAAIQFISRLDDIVLREESYRLTAGLAAQRGQTEAIMKQIALASQATERAALCRGLIGGLKQPATEDPPEPTATR